MSTLLPPRDEAVTVPSAAPATTAAAPAPETKARFAWAAARITLGWTFLWAFVDKLFGLGFATPAENAWVNGGSPTFGFLSFGTNGPFAGAFQSIAGATWADWLFMTGLLGVGVALILGIGLRLAASSGAAMMILMYAAAPVLENNPMVDDHIVYAIVLVGLALAGAGRTLGLGRQWEQLSIVQRFPILK